MKKTCFKILVTSPKGGVGKSTMAANLAVYLQRNDQSVTLLDFDNHGSSSSWLKRAPNVGVIVQHQPLPLTQGGNRSMLEARLHLRRAAVSSDVVICDLTWSNSIAGELMFEFDLVIVPTSVSEIELAATIGFLSHYHWVFNSAIHASPMLLLSPMRVQVEQLAGDAFTKQRFPVRFILSPPILEAQSAKVMFERGYLMDMADDCGRSFVEFAKAVIETQSIRDTNLKIEKVQTTGAMPKKGVLDRSNSMSSRDLLLGRHRCQKYFSNDDGLILKKDEQLKPVIGNIVSRLLTRLTA